MRYACLRYKWEHTRINLGDDIQQVAIDYIYKCAGINREDVVEVQYSELGMYDGEEVVLPICFPFHSYRENDNFTCFSDKIKPVFLNVSFYGTMLSDKDVAYLKKYEPIGCRDMMTYRLMKKYNIDAYHNGCVTMLFPRREQKGEDIFVVDVDSNIEKKILASMRELTTRVRTVQHELLNVPSDFDSYNVACELLKTYKEEAALVITSRMHCALPCAAMGIPVIFCGKRRSQRFEGIDQIVPFCLYDELPDTYDDVQPIIYDEIKKKILDLDIKRLRFESVNNRDLAEIHSYFSRNEKKEYKVDILSDYIRFVDDAALKNEEFHYYLWGVTPIAGALFDYISNHYEKTELEGIIDKRKRMIYCGKETAPVEKQDIKEKSIWFVCSRNATDEAVAFFKQKGIVDYCVQDEF